MSSTTVPRRAGMTPTNTGRFQPPSAPVSGTKVRRGLTPRSVTKKKPIGGPSASFISQNKPKFTAEQQLKILQRLHSGNYKKGEGLQQFHDDFGTTKVENKNTSIVSKMTCKQNLFSSFASLDQPHPLASSTRNYGKTGSNDSLVSFSSSIISAAPSHSTTMVVMMGGESDANVTALEIPGPPRSQFSDDIKDGTKLPRHIKLLDDIVKEARLYFQYLQELASVQCRAQFSQLLPQEKIRMFFKSIDRIQNIIRKFLEGNPSDNMHLFMPSSTARSSPPPSVLHCDVEKHSQLIQTLYKLSDLMSRLEEFSIDGPKDLKLEANLETFKANVNKLEEYIKKQEEYSFELKRLMKMTEELNMEDTPGELGIGGSGQCL